MKSKRIITLLIFVFMLALALSIPSTLVAGAQVFKTLYDFTGGADGNYPLAGLVQDEEGNLYGTTQNGGTWDKGTVFKLDSKGNHTVLYAFTGYEDGANPTGDLIRDKAGNLYGTTLSGGYSRAVCIPGPYGCYWRDYSLGTVFKLDSKGIYTVLYSFTGYEDGDNPQAGLIQDKAGNLYGTTSGEAPDGWFFYRFNGGTVFKLDSNGNYTVLYTFTGGEDGGNPFAGLIQDKAGNLYGTTQNGGTWDKGTVFKLDSKGNETVRHSFTGLDGANPQAGLIQDKAGNLYGTTTSYGTTISGAIGFGTVFKLDSNGNETVLYTFTGGADGANSLAGLVQDKKGNLYGTTAWGGTFNWGTVFKLDSNGNETVLHSFTGLDGAIPHAGFVQDKEGNLYSTTVWGGTSGSGFYGSGTVFKLRLECDDDEGNDKAPDR
jgi:uncharacterized repeat protein (TIGR03803 family)